MSALLAAGRELQPAVSLQLMTKDSKGESPPPLVVICCIFEKQQTTSFPSQAINHVNWFIAFCNVDWFVAVNMPEYNCLFFVSRILLRVRLLYYLKQEVVGDEAEKILSGAPSRY